MSMRECLTLIIANAGERPQPFSKGDFSRAEWLEFQRTADAVLDALMEPTEEMMENEDDLSLSIWKAMIRAAKEGK